MATSHLPNFKCFIDRSNHILTLNPTNPNPVRHSTSDSKLNFNLKPNPKV